MHFLPQGGWGKKQIKGFITTSWTKKGKPAKIAAAEVLELLKPVINGSLDISDEDIIARMLIPMATELARCVEEGIVESPAEADMALVYGTGFPPFRGGVFRWIDSIGAQVFCDMAARFGDLGPLYQAPASLLAKAANNQKFYG